MPATNFNYASYAGYESFAAAIIFVVAYIPLACYYPFLWFKLRSGTVFTMILFSQVRIVAFVIRAVMIKDEAAAETEGLFIADQVLFSAGFLGLLLAAYELVLAREARLSKTTNEKQTSTRSRRTIFHVAGMASVALAITAATKATSDPDAASTYRKASTIIFLVMAVFQSIQAIMLIRKERSHPEEYAGTPMSNSVGVKHGALLLGAISALCLVREVFYTATFSDTAKAYNEAYWYPLSALPEILIFSLFAAPGLIPAKVRDNKIPLLPSSSY
ncbi:hypothetical protein CYLTODRAFT_486842 [Cylindrobasidium torrendii FP15055 ss-10]|uniref:DUF7702 domain-containing protein n=1 Tax=Cylindrobasidium torrendii FP15055 ss-10 TaxID=1314674 RepID=A0A0D7BMW7_9AGAR|nr:hypothetical protein CYLTODRAFT_486842 [Cylindrobasidium torrendii FP15055 ss-10]